MHPPPAIDPPKTPQNKAPPSWLLSLPSKNSLEDPHNRHRRCPQGLKNGYPESPNLCALSPPPFPVHPPHSCKDFPSPPPPFTPTSFPIPLPHNSPGKAISVNIVYCRPGSAIIVAADERGRGMRGSWKKEKGEKRGRKIGPLSYFSIHSPVSAPPPPKKSCCRKANGEAFPPLFLFLSSSRNGGEGGEGSEGNGPAIKCPDRKRFPKMGVEPTTEMEWRKLVGNS